MESLVNAFISIFSLLTDNTFLNIPIIVWFILPAVIGIIIKFIEGKR